MSLKQSKINYELHGQGFPLILGYPFMATANTNEIDQIARQGYLDRLTDRYRVLTMDYPNVGPSERFPAEELTAQRICDDILNLADTAGFDRFIWWGFSLGGVLGLQLASRSERVAALVCGGWPPIGGQYASMLRAMYRLVKDAPPGYDIPLDQFVTFYESVQGWSEAGALQRIRCPKLTFVGTADELKIAGETLRLAASIREHRSDLEQQGWEVAEIEGRDHWIYQDPATVMPIVGPFLDRALLNRTERSERDN